LAMTSALRLAAVASAIALAASIYLALPPAGYVIGSPIEVDGWVITARGVVEAKYLKLRSCCGLTFYRAEKGFKFVLVNLEAVNAGGDYGELFRARGFRLITDRGAYPRARLAELKPIPVEALSGEVLAEFVEFSELPDACVIAPGESIRGDLIFVVPATERPSMLEFEVAGFGVVRIGLEGGYSPA